MVSILKKLIFTLPLFLLLFVFSITTVFAKGEENNFTVGRDEFVDRDVFAKGEVVTISGIVNGDVYAVAEKIVVDGTINGDLLAGAGNIVISGNVTDDVRVGAGDISVSGNIGKNVTAGAGNITFLEGSNVGGSVLAGASKIEFRSAVGRNVTVGAENVILGPQAQLGGDLVYMSKNQALVDNSATIAGTTTHNVSHEKTEEKKGLGGLFFFKFLSFIFTLGIGYLLLRFTPIFTKNVTNKIRTRPFFTFLIGLLMLFLGPIVGIVLAITVVGIPIAIALFAYYVVGIYFAKIFISLIFGEFFLKRINYKGSPVMTLFSGLVIYSIVTFIPVIGVLVSIATALCGLAALYLVKINYLKDLRAKKLV